MIRRKLAPEFEEQETFMKWLAVAYPRVYEMTYSVPNGRTSAKEGAKFKRLGAKAGVPDVCVAFPVKPYHGCYIEFKRRDGGVLSELQESWLERLSAKGYAACVACGWEEGKKILEDYLKPLAYSRNMDKI